MGNDTDLQALAAEIRKEHASSERKLADFHRIYDTALPHLHRCKEHQFRCGELLIKAKLAVGHGNWLEWLETNVPALPQRTAQHYMLQVHKWGVSEDGQIRNLADLTQPIRRSRDLDDAMAAYRAADEGRKLRFLVDLCEQIDWRAIDRLTDDAASREKILLLRDRVKPLHYRLHEFDLTLERRANALETATNRAVVVAEKQDA